MVSYHLSNTHAIGLEGGIYYWHLLKYNLYGLFSSINNKSNLLNKSNRHYSVNNNNDNLDEEFIEWFRGFTDAEGCFYIKLHKGTQYSFRFIIVLHIDDTKALEYIQKTLGIGTVVQNKNVVTFTVVKQMDILKIINIFDKNPLNSNKQLNFLAFKKAFELYVNTIDKSSVFKSISDLKNSMNKSRIDFEWSNREVNITPGWLLGFTEGEGSFSVRSSNSNKKDMYRLSFSIGQSDRDIYLMESIQEYFYKLSGDKFNIINRKDSVCYLYITQNSFIKNVLIGLFSSLEWHTKKEHDFKDWVLILKLKEKGFHYTEKGIEIINGLISQMNRYRLSTFKNSVKIDREQLLKEANELLNSPSNFVNIDGRVYINTLNRFLGKTVAMELEIQDENGNILKTFKSGVECGKYFNLSSTTIYNRIKENKPVFLNNKYYYIKRIDHVEE